VVFSVPDLAPAEHFYSAFGLDVRRSGAQLDLHTHGHAHRWVSVVGNGQPKRLQFLSFGIHAADEAALRHKVERLGLNCPPHPMGEVGGIWLRARTQRHQRAARRGASGRVTCRTCWCSRPICRVCWRSANRYWACACRTVRAT
jgi:hypothetical protein